MTFGGDGGVVLLFCLGSGGSGGGTLAFSGLFGDDGWTGAWLMAFENGGRRCS